MTELLVKEQKYRTFITLFSLFGKRAKLACIKSQYKILIYITEKKDNMLKNNKC